MAERRVEFQEGSESGMNCKLERLVRRPANGTVQDRVKDCLLHADAMMSVGRNQAAIENLSSAIKYLRLMPPN